MLDSETRRTRAKQAGMLMQAYGRAFTPRGGSDRLSQEGLLKLMGQVDPIYLERYNHSTVARWESGATCPTRKRLKVFGQALNLSEAEVEGLIRLAGLYEESETTRSLDGRDPQAGPEQGQVSAGHASESAGYSPSFFVQGIRYPNALAIPDHTLIRSWEIDFAALGYPKDELMDRYRIGAVWSSLATVVYMVVSLGGSLFIAIYRLGERDQPNPAGDDV